VTQGPDAVSALVNDVEAARAALGEAAIEKAPMLPVKVLIATELMLIQGMIAEFVQALFVGNGRVAEEAALVKGFFGTGPLNQAQIFGTGPLISSGWLSA
jgi:hypothetical protein